MTRRTLWLTLLLSAAAAGAVALLLASRLLALPDAALAPPLDPGEGLRFQQSVAQVFLRQGGLSQRSEPVVVTASELNAFLAQHVTVRHLDLRSMVVRIEAGWLEVAGRTSPRHLLGGPSTRWLLDVMPGPFLDLDVWLAARGRLRTGDGHGEFLVERAAIGRQPVPPSWLWRLLGTGPSELVGWRMPRIVERVELEPGRLVLHTRRHDGPPQGAPGGLSD